MTDRPTEGRYVDFAGHVTYAQQWIGSRTVSDALRFFGKFDARVGARLHISGWNEPELVVGDLWSAPVHTKTGEWVVLDIEDLTYTVWSKKDFANRYSHAPLSAEAIRLADALEEAAATDVGVRTVSALSMVETADVQAYLKTVVNG